MFQKCYITPNGLTHRQSLECKLQVIVLVDFHLPTFTFASQFEEGGFVGSLRVRVRVHMRACNRMSQTQPVCCLSLCERDILASGVKK